MSHCKNCKYWEEAIWNSDRTKELNLCAYPKQLWDSTEWSKLEETDEFGRKNIRTILPSRKDVLAFVQDGSDYKANLFTRAEFGCVAFVENNQ